MKEIKKILLSGMEVIPIIEGGKGLRISNGYTAGAFAAVGTIGTFSGVNAQVVDINGNIIPMIFKGKDRIARHIERIEYSIKGSIAQARIAYEISKGNGRIHMNLLWGMSGTERILHEVLEATRGILHGVTCGAGMPFNLGKIASKYETYYYPIVSSVRAFKILWIRAYNEFSKFLGGVVYEDPWKAGGHNGLSNNEKYDVPEDPYPRIIELRKYMKEVGLKETPIIIAGGIWNLKDYENWFSDPEIAPVAFQFGTRTLLTKENPVSAEWKSKLLTLKKHDIVLRKHSPTGFYSSAVKNVFLNEVIERSERQINYREKPEEKFNISFLYDNKRPVIYINDEDKSKAIKWIDEGYIKGMRTPDSSIIFVTEKKGKEIRQEQSICNGCLAKCSFSSWHYSEDNNYTTGKIPDPRSYCITKTLGNIIDGNDIENELMFSGHNAFNFTLDPFYANGNIPTTKELVEKILTGD